MSKCTNFQSPSRAKRSVPYKDMLYKVYIYRYIYMTITCIQKKNKHLCITRHENSPSSDSKPNLTTLKSLSEGGQAGCALTRLES